MKLATEGMKYHMKRNTLPGRDLKGLVGPKCESQASGRWYCVAHDYSAQHNMDKDQHMAKPGPHALAWICFEHGIEVP